MPDKGYESKLSPEEYKLYLAYREKRDGFGQFDENEDADQETAAKLGGFVDKPLQLAMEYLQGKLGP